MDWQTAGTDVKYCKFGNYGLQGSGKTFTMAVVARLIARLTKQSSVYMLDSEGGSDFVARLFATEGMSLQVRKTREFGDLVSVFETPPASGAVVLVDSISHFDANMKESYLKARKREALQLQDWQTINNNWRLFSRPYVNAPVHGLICGRVSGIYETARNDQGRLEFYQVDTKMKAADQFGHEPAMLFHMEQIDNAAMLSRMRLAATTEERQAVATELHKATQIDFVCTVEKDRTQLLQGRQEIFHSTPDIEAAAKAVEAFILPVVEWHLRGKTHGGIQETGATAALLSPAQDEFKWQEEKRRRDIALEELEAQMVKWIPGQSGKDKALKGDVLEALFRTRSWTRVTTYPLDPLEQLVAKNPPGTLSQVELACQAVVTKSAEEPIPAVLPPPANSRPSASPTAAPKPRVAVRGAK